MERPQTVYTRCKDTFHTWHKILSSHSGYRKISIYRPGTYLHVVSHVLISSLLQCIRLPMCSNVGWLQCGSMLYLHCVCPFAFAFPTLLCRVHRTLLAQNLCIASLMLFTWARSLCPTTWLSLCLKSTQSLCLRVHGHNTRVVGMKTIKRRRLVPAGIVTSEHCWYSFRLIES